MQRLVKLHFDPQALRFDSPAQYGAFLQAIGRLVVGMADPEAPSDVTQFVSVFVDRRQREAVACYHAPIPRTGSYETDRPVIEADAALAALRAPNPFVLGAVPDQAGLRYSFNS